MTIRSIVPALNVCAIGSIGILTSVNVPAAGFAGPASGSSGSGRAPSTETSGSGSSFEEAGRDVLLLRLPGTDLVTVT